MWYILSFFIEIFFGMFTMCLAIAAKERDLPYEEK